VVLEEEEPDFRLRPFPFEEVYWYRARINNSRLVRQPDARARRKCWQALGASALAAVLLILLSLPSILGTIAGYRIHTLEQERSRLQAEIEALDVQEAALLSPQRLEQLAPEMQLRDPAPGQILVLNPKADGSLAKVVPAK
jgi:cell division protein FtsL